MWLLDSNVFRAFSEPGLDGRDRVTARGDRVGWSNVAIPVVVATEALEGRLRYLDQAFKRAPSQLVVAYQKVQAIVHVVSMFPVIPFDGPALAVYQDGTLSGAMSRNDRLIAAIALAGGHVLVTRNVAHFQGVRGLRIENWIDEPVP